MLKARLDDLCSRPGGHSFDGALDAASEIVFYLAPLIEAWEAPTC